MASKNYEQVCKCCHKCGKTFYKKGNKQETLSRWASMMLRLHRKKCEGNLMLDDRQIDIICDAELEAYNAPIKSLSKNVEEHHYDEDNTLNLDVNDYIKLWLKTHSK